MRVKEIMSPSVTVGADDTLQDVFRMFSERSISGAPVVDERENLIGVISESDMVKAVARHQRRLRLVYPSLSFMSVTFEEDSEGRDLVEVVREIQRTPVSSVMGREVITLSPEDGVKVALERMTKGDVNRLPVVEDGKVVGIVARGDIIGYLSGHLDEES
ncbi:MAG: HPP family protein [Methanomassiliicoccales archaeon]